MTRTLLVTNDFAPKVGGIQQYLDELWRRLDPAQTAVLTASSHPDAARYDRAARERGLSITRVPSRTLYLPTARARAAVGRAITHEHPDLVLYDPFVPLGLIGAHDGVPYGVVLHGAEVTIPARVIGLRSLSRRVLRGASVVVAAGGYPLAEARLAAGELCGAVIEIPPGVDTTTFTPLAADQRARVRARFSLPARGELVTSVGRLVPRKGIDVLIGAIARCSATRPELTLVVAGDGRDRARLTGIARRSGARVHFLGRITEADKVALLGASDLFCQPCRTRWGGLEQEGFGIVFLEAAACGIAQVAGRSGGSDEAVIDGQTGRVVDDPTDVGAVAAALDELLSDAPRREAMGAAARERAVAQFDYDVLARRLADGLAAVGSPRAATS